MSDTPCCSFSCLPLFRTCDTSAASKAIEAAPLNAVEEFARDEISDTMEWPCSPKHPKIAPRRRLMSQSARAALQVRIGKAALQLDNEEDVDPCSPAAPGRSAAAAARKARRQMRNAADIALTSTESSSVPSNSVADLHQPFSSAEDDGCPCSPRDPRRARRAQGRKLKVDAELDANGPHNGSSYITPAHIPTPETPKACAPVPDAPSPVFSAPMCEAAMMHSPTVNAPTPPCATPSLPSPSTFTPSCSPWKEAEEPAIEDEIEWQAVVQNIAEKAVTLASEEIATLCHESSEEFSHTEFLEEAAQASTELEAPLAQVDKIKQPASSKLNPSEALMELSEEESKTEV